MKAEELKKFQRRLHTSSYMYAEGEISHYELERLQAEILEEYAQQNTLSHDGEDEFSPIDLTNVEPDKIPKSVVGVKNEEKIRATFENLYDKYKNKGKTQFTDAVMYYITTRLISTTPQPAPESVGVSEPTEDEIGEAHKTMQAKIELDHQPDAIVGVSKGEIEQPLNNFRTKEVMDGEFTEEELTLLIRLFIGGKVSENWDKLSAKAARWLQSLQSQPQISEKGISAKTIACAFWRYMWNNPDQSKIAMEDFYDEWVKNGMPPSEELSKND